MNVNYLLYATADATLICLRGECDDREKEEKKQLGKLRKTPVCLFLGPCLPPVLALSIPRLSVIQ